MELYRFKTKKEFKKDGLLSSNNIPSGWSSSMINFMGKTIPSFYNGDCEKHRDFCHGRWRFSKKDYVLINPPIKKLYPIY